MKNMWMQWVVSLSSALVLSACVPGGSETTPFQKFSSGGTTVPSTGGSTGSGSGSNTGGGNTSGGEGGFIGGGSNGNGGDHGFVAPVNLLFCGESGQIVLKKNQRALLTWAYPNGYVPSTALQFTLESDPAGITPMGTITSETNLSAWFQAPSTIATEFSVNVRAALADATTPAVCKIRLIPDAGLGIEDDGTTRGAVGNVFVLPSGQPQLPDFSQMTPVAAILVPNFDVPERAFSMGFPGVPELFEWFGIRFEGRLVVPQTGSYQLKLNSDDGSILWIDGVKVIDNDGVHAPIAITKTLNLTVGNHPFRLDYYQGPRYLIALELFWKKPGDSALTMIPPDNFLRPE